MVPLRSIVKNCVIALIITVILSIILSKFFDPSRYVLITETAFVEFCIIFIFVQSLSTLLKNGYSKESFFGMIMSFNTLILFESISLGFEFAEQNKTAVAKLALIFFIVSFICEILIFAWGQRKNIYF